MLNGVALYKKSIECDYQSVKRCFLIVNILKVRGCHVFTSGLVIRGVKEVNVC